MTCPSYSRLFRIQTSLLKSYYTKIFEQHRLFTTHLYASDTLQYLSNLQCHRERYIIRIFALEIIFRASRTIQRSLHSNLNLFTLGMSRPCFSENQQFSESSLSCPCSVFKHQRTLFHAIMR